MLSLYIFKVLRRVLCLVCLCSVCLYFLGCSRYTNESFTFLGQNFAAGVNRVLEEEDPSSRFALMQEILKQIYATHGIDSLRSFVHQYTLELAQDPFNSYYLFAVAELILESEAELSSHYYRSIVNNYPDVIVHSTSTHYSALRRLLSFSSDPAERISYYRLLIDNFSQSIDLGETWYLLAQEYRANAEYASYYDALIQFQNYPETVIQGKTNIHQEVSEEIDFHFNSRKDWTHPNLDTLVANITFALRNKQVQTLERYRAKETFFAVSWLQDSTVSNTRPHFDLSRFLLNARQISYADEFQSINENEAYLKTSGWSFRIPIWYFYFRKVDYPADPEIHGNWEWTGVFFGDTI